METIIKLNNQTAGRDKIARLLQYLSRVLWHRLQINNKNGVDSFKSLEYQLSTFRKVLRFGRCIDVLYSALPLYQYSDGTIRLTVILSKISNSLFLLADHFLWLGRSELCDVDTAKWSRISNKYWLFSIVLNLVRDFYEISNILKAQKYKIIPINGLQNLNDVFKAIGRAFVCIQQKQNRSIMVDTVKNGCDFFIPLSALGHVELSPGTVGVLGVISSLAALMVLVDPHIKLSPS